MTNFKEPERCMTCLRYKNSKGKCVNNACPKNRAKRLQKLKSQVTVVNKLREARKDEWLGIPIFYQPQLNESGNLYVEYVNQTEPPEDLYFLHLEDANISIRLFPREWEEYLTSARG